MDSYFLQISARVLEVKKNIRWETDLLPPGVEMCNLTMQVHVCLRGFNDHLPLVLEDQHCGGNPPPKINAIRILPGDFRGSGFVSP